MKDYPRILKESLESGDREIADFWSELAIDTILEDAPRRKPVASAVISRKEEAA